MLHVADSLKPGTETYSEKRTKHTLKKALEAANISYNAFLEKLAKTGQEAPPNVPPPVLWSEPGLVVGGFAKGIVKEWQKLKAHASLETER